MIWKPASNPHRAGFTTDPDSDSRHAAALDGKRCPAPHLPRVRLRGDVPSL